MFPFNKTIIFATNTGPVPMGIIHRIMDQALKISTAKTLSCCDFNLYLIKDHPRLLILRWIEIDWSDQDDPIQQYSYYYFNPDGNGIVCPLSYTQQQTLKQQLQLSPVIYSQQFAIDHRITP